MTVDFETLGRDLESAFARHLAVRSGKTRRRRVLGLTATTAGFLCAAAIGSGVASDLNLDPTTWSVLGRGTVDDGRGEYVSAVRTADGSPSQFVVEHDDGLSAYDAFLLHQKTIAAARAASPNRIEAEAGPPCSAAELTQAETVALGVLRSTFARGTDADATKAAVDQAIGETVQPCQGRQWAGEQARYVYAGLQPRSKLIPGVE